MSLLLTNAHNLPRQYVDVVSPRERLGDKQISVTELINPPQIWLLEQGTDVEADVASRHRMFWGIVAHEALAARAGPNTVAEERLRWTDPATGWTVCGTPDLLELDDGVLTDWKTTSVKSMKYEKPEYTYQTNLYAHLLRLNGFQVKGLRIQAIFWDYDDSMRGADPLYPSAPVVAIPVPFWASYEAQQYMLERLGMHVIVREHVHDWPEGLGVNCTDEERWIRDEYAVWSKREGQTRPKRVFKKMQEATDWIDAQAERPRSPEDWWEIEVRKGDPIRCRRWCPVSGICPQWASEKAQDSEGRQPRLVAQSRVRSMQGVAQDLEQGL